jgi:hypothetical protein
MVFKRKSASAGTFNDPEQLYRALALTNDGPPALWAHQADVLRSWHGPKKDDPEATVADVSDVAIELPTGAGKTLVGGLIGEFRRRNFRERVAYLCPTKQLARQTAAKLSEYGIPNVLLINEARTWNAADRTRYDRAGAIAVSVYSHVFNSNPALDNAQLLLLDDAHAAESYVAGPWKLEVGRAKHESAYMDILSALVDALDPLVMDRLRTSTPDGKYASTVYLASPLGVAAAAKQLDQVLAAAVDGRKVADKARYAWRFLQGRIDRCMIYVSYGQLLIRPLIAPTLEHPAFNDPARRVYMSATLGAGGELERSFGRRRIARIPIPKGWENQGTGRRLIVFPGLTSDLSTDAELLDKFVQDRIANAGRAVVLTSDERTAQQFIDKRIPNGHKTLRAKAVEDNLDAFTELPAAALVLANRYDGIDLPDDDCRLVVLDGLPARGDLQERFLHSSLGAVEVLQERIRARIMQGSGRATRNARDYATVLVLGNDLTTYLASHDVQSALHPEVQAELEFGLDNSIDTTSAELVERLAVFDEHGQEWAEVDQDIVTELETKQRIDTPGSAELQRAARHEVAACEAIWSGQWERALTAIRQVLDQFRAARAPRRYAALWNYLGYTLAHRVANQTGDATWRATASSYYQAAQAASRGTSWAGHLAAPAESTTAVAPPSLDQLDNTAMTAVLNDTELTRSTTFDQEVATTRNALAAKEYTAYEAALVTLGRLAGAKPSYGNEDDSEDAAPDAVWIFGEVQWVIWEAKSMATAKGKIGADNVRQTGAHLRTVESARGMAAPGNSACLLVSSKPSVLDSARNLAEGHVYLVRPPVVLDLFDRVVRAWRTLRSRDTKKIDVATAAAIFQSEAALPTQWLPQFRSDPVGGQAT